MAKEKKRSNNFSTDEKLCLVEFVVRNYNTLFGKLSLNVTNAEKTLLWQGCLERINSYGVTLRSVSDLTRKWTEMKSAAKKNARERQTALSKTGGGPEPPPLKDYDQKIVSILPECVIAGIEGGFDSLEFVKKVEVSPSPDRGGNHEAFTQDRREQGLPVQDEIPQASLPEPTRTNTLVGTDVLLVGTDVSTRKPSLKRKETASYDDILEVEQEKVSELKKISSLLGELVSLKRRKVVAMEEANKTHIAAVVDEMISGGFSL